MSSRFYHFIKTTFLSIVFLFFTGAIWNVTALEYSKPAFEQIEYLLYDLNSPRTSVKDQPIIQTYIKINKNGEMYIVHNNRGKRYYSFKLSNDEIDRLNQILNTKTKLQNYLLKKKQNKGVFYAGYYHYLKYVDSNNKSHHLSFVGGQLTPELGTLLEMIYDIGNPYINKSLKVEDEFEIENELISEVYSSHLKNKNLPSITLPPPPAK